MDALFARSKQFLPGRLQFVADLGFAAGELCSEFLVAEAGVQMPEAFKVGGFVQPESTGQQFIFVVIEQRF
jgi:hypothetical protein